MKKYLLFIALFLPTISFATVCPDNSHRQQSGERNYEFMLLEAKSNIDVYELKREKLIAEYKIKDLDLRRNYDQEERELVKLNYDYDIYLNESAKLAQRLFEAIQLNTKMKEISLKELEQEKSYYQNSTLTCVCNNGFYPNSDNDECLKLPNNSYATRDGWNCEEGYYATPEYKCKKFCPSGTTYFEEEDKCGCFYGDSLEAYYVDGKVDHYECVIHDLGVRFVEDFTGNYEKPASSVRKRVYKRQETKPQSYSSQEEVNRTLNNGTVCSIGFAKSINGRYCVKIPKNAHYVQSQTDVWLCDDGYKEFGNSCIRETVNTTASSQPEKEDRPRTSTISKKTSYGSYKSWWRKRMKQFQQ